jgi:HPt (histidine-containing phosphotransfer) domain-containing protein
MDDFLTKPVDGDRLEAVLREHARRGAAVAPLPELVDLGRLTELDGMGERAVALVDRAVQNFVAGFPATLQSVRAAVRADEAAEVRHLTHKLRGSALTLGAMRVAAVAQELEDLADRGPVLGGELLVDRLAAVGREACDALVLHRFGRAAAS